MPIVKKFEKMYDVIDRGNHGITLTEESMGCVYIESLYILKSPWSYRCDKWKTSVVG